MSLGDVINIGYGKPFQLRYACILNRSVTNGQVGTLIWNDQGSGGKLDGSVYAIVSGGGQVTGYFLTNGAYLPPSNALAFVLRQSLQVEIMDASNDAENINEAI